MCRTMARYHLTPALGLQIAGYIRWGCFDHVAAEACGIPRGIFDLWLKRGRTRSAPAVFADFAREVRTARAMARVKAEMEAYKETPRAWLEHGPGRDRPGEPGWSGPVRPTDEADQTNPFANPELMHLFNLVLKALEKYPDAHAHLSEIIAKPFGKSKEPTSPTQGAAHDPPPSPP